MRTSFRARLLLLLLALLAATLLATTLAALRAANDNAESLLRGELATVERVFLQLLLREREQLRERGAVLVQDFGFKEAIASGDRRTMASALANHADRVDADLAVLLEPEGGVIMSTHELAPVLAALQGRVTGADSARSVRFVLDGQVFDAVLLPVEAPDLIGWIGVGRLVDNNLLLELRGLTGADIVLFADGSSALATLPPDLAPAGAGAASLATELREARWLTRSVPLATDAGGTAEALLTVSLEAALADFRRLRLQLVAIGALALLLAGLIALFAARSVTRPIRKLARFAERISDGDYSTRTEIATGTEFDLLAQTLNSMQDTVAEREARIVHQAQHDLLTQLPNRNYISAMFEGEDRRRVPGGRFGMALMALGNLGDLTDLYGSDFSDRCLREAADRLRRSLRRGDLAGRVGDNQLLLFLDDLEPAGLEPALGKFLAAFADPLEVAGVPVVLEPRFGCVFYPQHGASFDELLRRAQIALSRANRGAERFTVYQVGQDEAHLRQIRVANRLREAVEAGAFELLYQPKYSLRQARISSCEALVRWQDEELGPVFPDEFIPIAEQTGMITAISEAVLATALADLAMLREHSDGLAVSVNLSGIDILKPPFIDRVIEQVRESGLPASAVVLEITETAMVEDLELARGHLLRLDAAGLALSIDDFGTGFSSLGQLRALPARELKIDRSLVQPLGDRSEDRQIVASTIDMAHHLGLSVVAEGVENMEIVNHLHAMGCDVLQGYFLARPMPAEALAAWLDEPPAQVAALEHLARG
ncbi:putative bifunctional diguanylate cyclase/phosphodiesterase [Pseudohaliea rubra]|uniref:Diguanylate cyclase/phosphodiesterase (GGDEF & EAL domain protein) with PAS/PAC sensor(S) n=1 Tax=Pseudohaliea rubra DSM 19751 TaxID=1265313 RepID=A0A095VNJ2_9GAMM|nr:EAL domain-containing protein [Pseudohaliea rubra]KGE02658.1 diguanylate cyclase/phosphodiesterase (GGDEF & EAL domain protein) with PAS/PAC sensor(s) [Pseudohaliea rubra DSM 19751]